MSTIAFTEQSGRGNDSENDSLPDVGNDSDYQSEIGSYGETLPAEVPPQHSRQTGSDVMTETNSKCVHRSNQISVSQPRRQGYAGEAREEQHVRSQIVRDTDETSTQAVQCESDDEGGRILSTKSSILMATDKLPQKVRLMVNSSSTDVVLLHTAKDMLVPSGQGLGEGKRYELHVNRSIMRFETKMFLLDPPNL